MMRNFIPNFSEEPDSDDSSIGGINSNSFATMSDQEDDNLSPTSDDSELSFDEDSSTEALDDSSVLSVGCELDDDDSENDTDTESTTSEEDTSMFDIFGIKPRKERKDYPPDIHVDSAVVDVCFHPEASILATATMDGECILYNYSLEKCEEKARFSHHQKACRQLCFSEDGSNLFSISKDKSLAIVDPETGDIKLHIKDAHSSPIYSFQPISEDLCATGDDDGVVKLWDIRKKTSVMDFKCGEQTVTSLLSCEHNRYLAATVADGSLAGFNLSKRRLEAQSELYDTEFTCLSLIRSNSRLCVGSGTGTLFLFNWGEFGYHTDRYSGHPDQIQCQIPLSDKIIITGCEDGKIRAVHLYPHKFIGVIGKHKDFGVENLSVSSDGTFLASCSMDDKIQFWNIEFLYDQEIKKKKKEMKKAVEKRLKSSRDKDQESFFKDIKQDEAAEDENGPVPSTIDEADDLDL